MESLFGADSVLGTGTALVVMIVVAVIIAACVVLSRRERQDPKDMSAEDLRIAAEAQRHDNYRGNDAFKRRGKGAGFGSPPSNGRGHWF